MRILPEEAVELPGNKNDNDPETLLDKKDSGVAQQPVTESAAVPANIEKKTSGGSRARISEEAATADGKGTSVELKKQNTQDEEDTKSKNSSIVWKM